MAWTAPRSWVAGEVVTAAQLNTDVRDNENFLATLLSTGTLTNRGILYGSGTAPIGATPALGAGAIVVGGTGGTADPTTLGLFGGTAAVGSYRLLGTYGGLNADVSTATAGAVLAGASTGTFAVVAAGPSGQYYQSRGTGTIGTFAAVSAVTPGEFIGTGSASAQRWVIPGWVGTVVAINDGGDTRTYYTPIYLAAATTFDRIGVEHTTGTETPASVARLGVYKMGTDGRPGSLQFDAGTISLTSAVGEKVITITQALAGGTYYWLVLSHNHIVTAQNLGFRGIDLAQSTGWNPPISVGPSGSINGAPALGFTSTLVNPAVALADPAPAVASLILDRSQASPRVFLRIA